MKAALLTAHNAPLTLADVEPCPLAPGQVLVRMLVTGICGAQLAEIRGEKDERAPMPRLIGHEGCAIIEDVGPGVTKVAKGNKVVCHWRKSSGMESDFPRYRYDGREITSGRIATFAEFAILSENRVTRVPDETPNELCALLGCGLSTALGVMENEAKLKIGESVLVVGRGGVGLGLIRAARMMHAAEVESVGIGDSFPDRHFDVIMDTSGSADAFSGMVPHLAPSGRYILIGQPKPEQSLVIASARHLFDGEGKTIKATQGGQFDPDKDIPRYVAAQRSGALNIAGLVTHRFPLSEINQAIGTVRDGNAGRVMIEYV
jgi:S-(hydroxymethyl)glutathione dehydrogenase/alcohol dehydrogenase